MASWTFITNHGAVLNLVAQYPQITAREIASQIGITEWSVFRIISDLEEGGYLSRTREGRTNWYEVNHGLCLRRPEVQEVTVGELLRVLRGEEVETEAPMPPRED